jgi:hypothetical protein
MIIEIWQKATTPCDSLTTGTLPLDFLLLIEYIKTYLAKAVGMRHGVSPIVIFFYWTIPIVI